MGQICMISYRLFSRVCLFVLDIAGPWERVAGRLVQLVVQLAVFFAVVPTVVLPVGGTVFATLVNVMFVALLEDPRALGYLATVKFIRKMIARIPSHHMAHIFKA